MKKVVITICALGLVHLGLSAQKNQGVVPSLVGWSYYGGDEFNGTTINKSLWGIYGDKTKHYSYELYGNNKKQGNAQIYRDQMVTVNNGFLSIRATREPIKTGLRKYEDDPANTDYSIKMRKPIKPKHGYTKYGWWSGALSSRDAENGGNYYPLYSRIEIKAKIPFSIGTWMALWLRHCNGSSTFEIDLQEFFVHDDARTFAKDNIDKKRRYVHQSIHGIDYNLGTRYDQDKKKYVLKNGYNHNNYGDRIKEIIFDPSEDFHVYGAQIDPEPGDSSRNIAVSFLLDGRVRSVFITSYYKTSGEAVDSADMKPMKDKYPYRYNALLRKENFKNGIDRVWDVAITGQIGGKPDGKGGGILYPEMDPQYGGDINKVPKDYVMDIDWMRVYKRANKLIWIGAQPLPGDMKQTKAKIEIPTKRLGNLKIGDKLILDIDTLSSSKHRKVGLSSIDIYNKYGKSITMLKPQLSRNDAQVTFFITDKNMLEELKKEGCYIEGENIRIFSLASEKKESSIWNGFKQINKDKVIIPKEMFERVYRNQILEFTVLDVESQGKIILPQVNKSINLSATRDEKQYVIDLDAESAKTINKYGLQISGEGYYLRNVRLIDKKTVTGITEIDSPKEDTDEIYTISGMKVKEAKEKGDLRPGVYIIDGKKVLVK
ncbi:glycoside hydrolase family 16 protein [Prevotella pallens]|jgi:glycoside hydrolase, family 16|uniref:glycoside hydrolase family 16 protein n=1 Tax=Prevotella pallens TaxID=60133 RepID=UPI001CAE4EEA|nr:family 16 glycosylhydrolase [Prevotella pallens]MBF1444106.1 family 16 glycosylhydrolase [Prevotella pallens]MBF1483313.1 family 16 glycosylhydrolase [Prevotella pallens]MBF1495183.1 family 16 glycosylhydrolase [Prevotella pallens]